MSGIVASTLIRREWHPLLAKAARALNRINSVVPPPPSAVPATPQRVVIIHVHPNGREPSFTLALGEAVCESLEAAGHKVRVTNLYEESFDPVLGKSEHRAFPTAYRDGNVAGDLKQHVDNLRWCSALVLCYPTWWYSFPAILKGWFDRILMPGLAFDIPDGTEEPNAKNGLISRLKNIKKVGIVTTFGNGFWNVRFVGDPGRRIVCRGLRPLFHPECTVLWKGLYNVQSCPQEDRDKFLRDVRESFITF